MNEQLRREASAETEAFAAEMRARQAGPRRDRLNEQRIDLARTIAGQAQAIADGTVIGPQYGAVCRLAANVEQLAAWTEDDRR